MKLQKKLLIPFLLIVCVFCASAQNPQMSPLPIDPKVRYGTLDNGLTYYIRHNELPKERAEFFIAQKVGSVLEEDNQAGLAHFLEHMAFNGSKNLPGKAMIDYMEKIGVKFGENLNAYTGFDQTVYNVSNVPVTREGIIDTCLLVLHDWSNFISLDEDEMDKERGVIREEMRSRDNAFMRQLDILLPEIMPGSQYAKRMPIGTEKVVMGFKPDELRAYYHKWYRPDLQGIVIVGDIDVDQVEAKVKKLFADIPKPVNPAERIYYPVPDNDQPLVGVATDKEATGTNLSINFKHDPLPAEVKSSAAGLVMNYLEQSISLMLNDRFREILQKANPPFISAGGRNGDFLISETKEAFSFGAGVKEGGVENALKAVTLEIERVKQYGFTASEYDRARVNILKAYEMAYNERDKRRNGGYAEEYVSHFTTGGYIPGVEVEYNMINQIAPTIPVDAVNQLAKNWITAENIVLYLVAPEKEGVVVPAREQLLSWFTEAQKQKVEPYQDKVSNEPLIKTLPKPGKVVSVSKNDKFGATVYKLSNGVKVVVKPTTFKDDEILMSATSPGGSSHFPESDATNIKLYESVVTLGGLGNFSTIDLNKVLAGKKASALPTINLVTEGFTGSSSVKDFETMLQLVYLRFTAPRMDDDAYKSFVERVKSQLASSEVDPMNAFTDTVNALLYQDPVRYARLTVADLKSLNYQTIMNWYKDRYKDASDFTFTLVGNIDEMTAKPLIEQYLGALLSINRKESYKEVNANYKGGVRKSAFNKEMQTPKANVFDVFSGKMSYELANEVKMSMLSQILRIVYTEKVREDEGGTYGVNVGGGISNYPKGRTALQIMFQTNEEKKDYLNGIILKELGVMKEQGPRPEDFNKVKEFMVKKFKENEQENEFWRNQIQRFYSVDAVDGYTSYLTILNSITPEDIRVFTKQLLDQNNSLEIIMNGVKPQQIK